MRKSKYIFHTKDWFTPNSYNNNFSYPPKSSGVYMIVLPVQNDIGGFTGRYKILYIGCSRNLQARKASHEKLKKLGLKYGYIQFYFKTTPDYKEYEKTLIKKFKPKYNIIGKQDA